MDDALPEVRYTRSGDVEIAYQVLGSGDIDLVLVMGWLTNLETYWEELNYRRFMQRLAAVAGVARWNEALRPHDDRHARGAHG